MWYIITFSNYLGNYMYTYDTYLHSQVTWAKRFWSCLSWGCFWDDSGRIYEKKTCSHEFQLIFNRWIFNGLINQGSWHNAGTVADHRASGLGYLYKSFRTRVHASRAFFEPSFSKTPRFTAFFAIFGGREIATRGSENVENHAFSCVFRDFRMLSNLALFLSFFRKKC